MNHIVRHFLSTPFFVCSILVGFVADLTHSLDRAFLYIACKIIGATLEQYDRVGCDIDYEDDDIVFFELEEDNEENKEDGLP